jgi:protein CpxP
MHLELRFATALLALVFPLTAAMAVAQSGKPTRTPDQVLRMYDQKLSLTNEEKTSLRPIIAERQQKMEELRADTSMRPRERMKKLHAEMDNSDKRIRAILTPEQARKYTDMEAERKEQMKERREEKK